MDDFFKALSGYTGLILSLIMIIGVVVSLTTVDVTQTMEIKKLDYQIGLLEKQVEEMGGVIEHFEQEQLNQANNM